MRALSSAGAAFLLCVLWFDLMFDVQVRRHPADAVPTAVLDSISAYYARVTTAARPMNRLIALAMLVTLGALTAELVRGDIARWRAGVSLLLAAGAIGLAGARTVRNAVRLGARTDAAPARSQLAHTILRDHVVCFAAIVVVLALQLAPA